MIPTKYIVAILGLLVTGAASAQTTVKPFPDAGKWQQSKPLLRERDQDRYRNSSLIQAERKGELVPPMNLDKKLPLQLLRSSGSRALPVPAYLWPAEQGMKRGIRTKTPASVELPIDTIDHSTKRD